MDLVLVIRKEPFAAIEAGLKKHEYREIKPHWQRRIEGRSYDAILFINGYRSNARRARYELVGVSQCLYKGKPHYDLLLGDRIPS